MTHVFISYSHQDTDFANRLADGLVSLGVESWIDRAGIQAGERWSSSIQEGLDASRALVLILSPGSMASTNCEDEWQYFLDQGKPVLPVLHLPAKIHFQLSRLQYIDFHGQPFDRALPQLVEGIERLLAEAEAEEGEAPVGEAPGDETTGTALEGDSEGRPTASAGRITLGPPSGTVTFLFTDIEGSTERWEHFPEAMKTALARHDALLRASVQGRGGYVFKTVGDAFCATFLTAAEAVGAALDAQRALHAENWSDHGDGFAEVRVRMGLHTGEAHEREGDYFGPPVNRCARLEAAANGGQVLLSRATYQLARESLPEGVDLRDLGEHRLKDLRFSEHIFQLVAPDLPDLRTPLRTAEALHPRDRVVVGGARGDEAGEVAPGERAPKPGAPEEPPGDSWSRLHTALIDDTGETVVLTPEEAAELAREKPADLRRHRLGRIAEWSQPRYRLDGRFVGLSLLIDQGEDAVTGRWQASEERFDDLRSLLAAQDAPVAVVLGPPGAGKSTLLRRLELDSAIAALRGEGPEVVTLFVPLNTYASEDPEASPPPPQDFLAQRWARRNPELPSLDQLLAEGRMLLLLDALNELPAAGEADFRKQVTRWKSWLQRLAADHPGNRVVFSCRALDYSQPLSTPELRVPQVRIEALSDKQVVDFLQLYSPGRWREIWQMLDGQPQLEVLRSPYFLSLLVEQVEASGEMPSGRAGLFTGFVRQALRREVERGNPLFEPGELLHSRDLRRISRWRWKTPWDLPERGLLVPKLAALAHEMQEARADGERTQVRVDFDDALDLLDDDQDEAIVAAGAALAVLDEDEAAGELMYIHQLVQEYFAARALADEPDPSRVRHAWRADAVDPPLAEVLEGLDPADPLPPLPSSGWEETTVLAAAMADDPADFVRAVMPENLVVAGRCAAQAEVAPRMPSDLMDELRSQLLARSQDPAADLRERIACGRALGELGDSRLSEGWGAEGHRYLLPPMIEIPGGTYPIGDDDPYEIYGMTTDAHVPRHEVEIAPFALAQFAVTNAEFACFIEAGGYEDERWWTTEDAKAWRRGETTAEGWHAIIRTFREMYIANPERLEESYKAGAYDDTVYELWKSRLSMTEEDLELHLVELYPGGRITEPRQWRDSRCNHPSQPVVGVSWYEAQAYCRWLSDQANEPFRLPTEVEWESAANGIEGRRFAWGDAFDPMRTNALASHVRRSTPAGVFRGVTPEGVLDLAGNSADWTNTAYGATPFDDTLRYPYRADGREAPEAAKLAYRIVRGGGWRDPETGVCMSIRDSNHVTMTQDYIGFRICRG